MRLSRITLEHFRNIPLTELTLVGRQQFFIGQNVQGKTNLTDAGWTVVSPAIPRRHYGVCPMLIA